MLLSERIERLTALHAPSGWEDAVREAIREELKARENLRVFSDTMGNLFAVRAAKRSGLKRVMLCAHMDEVGLIVRHVTEDGLLKFDPVGRVDPRVLVSKRVCVGEAHILGVIGCKAVHLMTEEEQEQAPTFDSLSIDIGAENREDAERLCPRGSYATFDSGYRAFGDGFIKAKALGSRAGCAIALNVLLESDYAGELACAFTAQKEVGLRGAMLAARRIQPDTAIVLDGVPARDLGKTDAHARQVECGKGAVISWMDESMIADKPLRTIAVEAAKKRGIPVQIRRAADGKTDAGAIHLCGAGVPSLVIGLPVRYLCSPTCVARMTDVEAVQWLTLTVLEEMEGK